MGGCESGNAFDSFPAALRWGSRGRTMVEKRRRTSLRKEGKQRDDDERYSCGWRLSGASTLFFRSVPSVGHKMKLFTENILIRALY